MDELNIKELDKQYIANTYERFDLVPAEGKGTVCFDRDGKKYIDFSSGIGVNSLGFCDDGWIQAVTRQLHKLQHISNLYYTQPCVEAAQLLCQRSGMCKVFFANSGAEANEGAIKTARKYSSDKYGSQRYEILCLENSFHGRTITTLAATGQEVFHKHFDPFTEGFVFAKANDIQSFHQTLSPKTCAVLIELVQGEGGVVPLNADFVAEIARVCAEKDLLLIVDEVQTGVGRTGKLFCYEHFGLKPDIVTLAKGLGAGLPIGAVLFGEKTQRVLGFGDHGTTFGGNPIVAAGAVHVLQTIDQALLDEITAKGSYITDKVMTFPRVRSVTGKGLMLGIELDRVNSKAVVQQCIKAGLITLTAKSKLRMLPPLTITYEEINCGLEILKKVLEEIE